MFNMSTPSDEPNPSASNNDSPPRSKLAEILRISIKTVPLILTFSLLTWALVRYGERSSGEVGTLCNSRSQQSSGFGGDSDFYGLGIRLGLYLQWASSFITNWFTPTEREPVVVTYIIFNLSITMAVLARVFGQQCTFVAEMFVVLTMFWGGLNVILLVPLLRGISTDRYHEISPKDRENALQILKTSQSLKWASNLSNCFMSPITIWFWARLVVVGQQDFATTPGQTSLFFFARIQGQGVRALSIFMTVASVINFLWFNWLLFPLEVDLDLQNKNLERILGGLVWGPLNTLLIPVCILFELATVLTMILMSVLTFTLGLLFGAIALARAHNVLFNPDVSGTPDLSGPVDVPDKTEQSTMRLIR